MIAITAATGRLGQAVIKELEARGLGRGVRLTARSPEKLAAHQAKGFEVARADYDDPASLAAAFAGVETLLLVSGMGPNAVRIAHHRAAVDAAKAAGVRRIVYTSSVNPVATSKFVWIIPHVETEAYLKASGLAYVFLRDNQYAANLDGVLAKAKETGVLAMPGAKGKVAYVTHADVAAAAVGALTGAAGDNTAYELTGPAAYDAWDVAKLVSGALGRPIEVADVAIEEYIAGLRAAGLPEFVVEGLSSFAVAAAAGEHAAVTDDVARLSGRPATPLETAIKTFYA